MQDAVVDRAFRPATAPDPRRLVPLPRVLVPHARGQWVCYFDGGGTKVSGVLQGLCCVDEHGAAVVELFEMIRGRGRGMWAVHLLPPSPAPPDACGLYCTAKVLQLAIDRDADARRQAPPGSTSFYRANGLVPLAQLAATHTEGAPHTVVVDEAAPQGARRLLVLDGADAMDAFLRRRQGRLDGLYAAHTGSPTAAADLRRRHHSLYYYSSRRYREHRRRREVAAVTQA